MRVLSASTNLMYILYTVKRKTTRRTPAEAIHLSFVHDTVSDFKRSSIASLPARRSMVSFIVRSRPAGQAPRRSIPMNECILVD